MNGGTVVRTCAAVLAAALAVWAGNPSERRPRVTTPSETAGGTDSGAVSPSRYAVGSASALAPVLQEDNIPYDGRFIFLRIRYAPGLRRFGRFREPPWHHDHPRAERNLTRILEELTFIEAYKEGGNILTTDDPEISRYPIAYLSEPGFWEPSEAEVEGLRNYLLKGGFLIFDDFGGSDWYNFEAQLRRVLPEGQLVQLDTSHPIFNSFFEIESLDFFSYQARSGPPRYLGIHEDNDPTRRLMVVVNYNNDIGEYWEYSDTGWYPIDLTNEAYKIGVNYIVYAMTH